MKRFKLLPVLIACIILVSGCDAKITQTDDTVLPKEDNATEITIEVWDNTNFYVNAAPRFEEETGIKVNVINNYKTGQSITEGYSANEERIQAELMAGKGSDIYAGIYLDFIGIGQTGHLCNLANWIAEDSSFSDDAYYMNILKSGFDDGDVYSVPLFMMFSALGSTIEVPELRGQSLSWEEFFELAQGIKRSGVLYGITDYEIFRRRFRDRYHYFIDKENKTQNLDSPEMVELMAQCKKWSSEGLCIQYGTENYTEMFENAFFKEPGGGGMDLLTNFRFDNPYLDNEFYNYDIPSDSGKNDKANKISTKDFICINAASPYKGTAWKFVKFLLSEDIQVAGLFTPVNRKAAVEHISRSLDKIVESLGVKIDSDKVIEESEAILDAVDDVPYSIQQTDIEKIIFKEAKRFFSNEISADAAAKSMAATMKLYFKEQ